MRQNLEFSILRTFQNEIGKARECCVSCLKRSLSGGLPMFAAMRRTSSPVMRPMESSGLAARHPPGPSRRNLKTRSIRVVVELADIHLRAEHVC